MAEAGTAETSSATSAARQIRSRARMGITPRGGSDARTRGGIGSVALRLDPQRLGDEAGHPLAHRRRELEPVPAAGRRDDDATVALDREPRARPVRVEADVA